MFRCALVAGPPSPTSSPSPGVPSPATVWMRPVLRVDHPDAVVQRVGDVDVAVRRGGDGARRVQRRLGRRLVVAVVAVLARAGDRRDDAASADRRGGCDRCASRRRSGRRRARSRRRPACRAAPRWPDRSRRRSRCRDRGCRRPASMLRVARVDAADDVVVRVGEVDVAVRRDGDAARRVEPGLDRRAVVAGVALSRRR